MVKLHGLVQNYNACITLPKSPFKGLLYCFIYRGLRNQHCFLLTWWSVEGGKTEFGSSKNFRLEWRVSTSRLNQTSSISFLDFCEFVGITSLILFWKSVFSSLSSGEIWFQPLLSNFLNKFQFYYQIFLFISQLWTETPK